MLKPPDCTCREQCAWKRRKLRIFVLLLCSCLRLSAQTGPAAVPSAEEVRQLATKQRWQDIALLLGPLRSRSADLNFYYGTALARLERWQEAENAFQAGLRLAPNDPRFLIELAGVAFKQKHYPQAARRLRRALKLAPHDTMPLIQSPNPKPRRTKITVRLDEPLARTVHRYAEFIRAIASLQTALTDSCGIPAISPC